MSYEAWLEIVDEVCRQKFGVGYEDLPDFCWRDYYDDGSTPEDAVYAHLNTYRTYWQEIGRHDISEQTPQDVEVSNACETCGMAISEGDKCNNCWEVESRLSHYLKSKKGLAYVTKAVQLARLEYCMRLIKEGD